MILGHELAGGEAIRGWQRKRPAGSKRFVLGKGNGLVRWNRAGPFCLCGGGGIRYGTRTLAAVNGMADALPK